MPENRRKTGFRGPSPDVGLATQFKPGQPSANPGGRPKTAPLSQACRELLAQPVPGDAEGRTYAQAIAAQLGEKAIAGDIVAIRELADRAEGRARQAIEIENTNLRDAFERMTTQELRDYAESGKFPEWFPFTEAEDRAGQ